MVILVQDYGSYAHPSGLHGYPLQVNGLHNIPNESI